MPKIFSDEELRLVLAAPARPELNGPSAVQVVEQRAWVSKWGGPMPEELAGVPHSQWWKRCKHNYDVKLAAARARFGHGQPAAASPPTSISVSQRKAAAERLGLRPHVAASHGWVTKNAPNIVDGAVQVGTPSLTPSGRHAKRTLTAMVSQAGGGSPRQVSAALS